MVFSLAKSLDRSSVPMETTIHFAPTRSSAGAASRAISTARSLAKNHPNDRKNVTTTVSFADHNSVKSIISPLAADRTGTPRSAANASTGASSGTLNSTALARAPTRPRVVVDNAIGHRPCAMRAAGIAIARIVARKDERMRASDDDVYATLARGLRLTVNARTPESVAHARGTIEPIASHARAS
jgi:hypothetical protein